MRSGGIFRYPGWNSKESTIGAADSTARSKAASEAVIRIVMVRADSAGPDSDGTRMPSGRSRM